MKYNHKKWEIRSKWYTLQIWKNGEWEDAGDVYDGETKQDCRSEMVICNFWPNKVRMVECVAVQRQLGKVKDTSSGYK